MIAGRGRFPVHHSGRLRCLLHQPVDNIDGRHTICFGVEVGDDAMAQDRAGQLPDVIDIRCVPSREESPCLGAENKVL